MSAHQIDPLQDRRWATFVERHARASVFHTPEWLDALRRTYGYEPVVLTTSSPGEDLTSGLVYCRVNSWLTGRRIISLPFSDHCEALVDSEDELGFLVSALKHHVDTNNANYLEIRPITVPEKMSIDLREADTFYLHQLDLRPRIEELSRRLHKNCVQRKIRRAEQEALSYTEGSSESMLVQFYRLLVPTRRSQQTVPQPIKWFHNLIACMGNKLKIRVASKDGRAIASILTLRYRDTLVYKYGCSDRKFNNLGGMHFLLWKSIQEAKNQGLSRFDLGRSDWDDHGLILFKDRWGADRSILRYWRYGVGSVWTRNASWQTKLSKHVFGHMPNVVLPLAGNVLYKHYA